MKIRITWNNGDKETIEVCESLLDTLFLRKNRIHEGMNFTLCHVLKLRGKEVVSSQFDLSRARRYELLDIQQDQEESGG